MGRERIKPPVVRTGDFSRDSYTSQKLPARHPLSSVACDLRRFRWHIFERREANMMRVVNHHSERQLHLLADPEPRADIAKRLRTNCNSGSMPVRSRTMASARCVAKMCSGFWSPSLGNCARSMRCMDCCIGSSIRRSCLGRSIHRPIPPRKKNSKKIWRAPRGDPDALSRPLAASLSRRRSAVRPARYADSRLGQNGFATPCRAANAVRSERIPPPWGPRSGWRRARPKG